MIFVNDGSTDNSWNVDEHALRAKIRTTCKRHKVPRNYGRVPALSCRFQRGEGRCRNYNGCRPQDSPERDTGLPHMTRRGLPPCSGLQRNETASRAYPLSKTIPTKLFNATASKVSGIHNLHDFNCGLKAYRKDVVKNIEVYGGDAPRTYHIWQKNAGSTRSARKAGAPPGTQVRQVEVYGLEPLLQRLSRPYHAVVPLNFRQKAYARVRIPRHARCSSSASSRW